MHLLRLLATGVVAVAAFTIPAAAEGKDFVDIAEIRVPDSDDAKATRNRIKLIRGLLRSAAKHADFGEAKNVQIHAKLTRFEVVEKDGILRVTCTLIGRLDGGPSARSHISFGGHPEKRKTLEKQVLRMVSDGIITRLAELAKQRATPD